MSLINCTAIAQELLQLSATSKKSTSSSDKTKKQSEIAAQLGVGTMWSRR
jgi:hypothetical protein